MASYKITTPTTSQEITQGDENERTHILADFNGNILELGGGDDEVALWRRKDFIEKMGNTYPITIDGNYFDGGEGQDTANIQLSSDEYSVELLDDGSVEITDIAAGESNIYGNFEQFIIKNEVGDLDRFSMDELLRNNFFDENARTMEDSAIVEGVDLELAKELSALSYFSNDAIKWIVDIPEYEYPNIHKIAVGNVKAIVVNDGEHTLVTFNGTDSISDIDASLSTELIDTPIGQVHSGYYERLHASNGQNPSLWEQVNSAIAQYDSPVIFTGTSMGGSVATLAAMQYELEYGPDNIEALYTFGQPKAGSQSFADRVNEVLASRYVRMATDDPVAGFPVDQNFAHAGHLFHLRSLDHEDGFSRRCIINDASVQKYIDDIAEPFWVDRDILANKITNNPRALLSLSEKYPQFREHIIYASALNDAFSISPSLAACNGVEAPTDSKYLQESRVHSKPVIKRQ